MLAYYLHWSHADIVNLPILERHHYIELLANQLSQEQPTQTNTVTSRP